MAKTRRPRFQINDRVTLAPYTPLIPAYGGKPFVGRETVLRVSSIDGKGTLRAPWGVNITDDEGHFWHMQPDDIVSADEAHATKRAASKRYHVYARDGFESAHSSLDAAERAARRGAKNRRMEYRVYLSDAYGLTGPSRGTLAYTAPAPRR